jgi:uncharacterized protein (DUF488 family)
MKIFTIGFTKKSAEEFFTRLSQSRATRLVDVRLNNVSQLAGFSKRDDLRYFVKAICGMEYSHLTELAPTQEMLDMYKKQKGDWQTYESRFLSLMSERQIENKIPRGLLDQACLLCSEHSPKNCHRKLVAEYLQSHWEHLEIVHL